MTKAKKIRASVRYDNHHARLRDGESQRKDGSYSYRWTDRLGNRHAVYAQTLEKLREKEEQVQADIHDGIRADKRSMTINEMYNLWVELKRGIRNTTMSNYMYAYECNVRPVFGQKKLALIKKTDIRRFYNNLHDVKGMKVNSIDVVHTVLHQVFQMAVDDDIIRSNPTENMLRELKVSFGSDSVKRHALTVAQQKIFQEYLLRTPKYQHWYPIFFIMANTGMRVGEIIGLRWQDVDFQNGLISVNHNVVYYNGKAGKGKFCYTVNAPKTRAGERLIPMTTAVIEAFKMEREFQDMVGIKNTASIDGYSDFIFCNRDGKMVSESSLNKALKRIIRDCNAELIDMNGIDKVPAFLPQFSCHYLRHTCATRLCESGMNLKMVQAILGHGDIQTTMNIYVSVTEDLRKKELNVLEEYLSKIE